MKGQLYKFKPTHILDEMVLSPTITKELKKVTSYARKSATVYKSSGDRKRIVKKISLFTGTDSTGKTLAAETLARSTKKDLYRIDLSQVASKYIGETEKNLENIFKRAENKDWILFFDQADALFGKRTDVKDSHDRFANIEISYLLERIENYPGLVILATNKKTNLDNAFIRRLRYIVEFPSPSKKKRNTKRDIKVRTFPTKKIL
jgi:SpoVK/Ycf46/Vps4 family AAA+-type ATPase